MAVYKIEVYFEKQEGTLDIFSLMHDSNENNIPARRIAPIPKPYSK